MHGHYLLSALIHHAFRPNIFQVYLIQFINNIFLNLYPNYKYIIHMATKSKLLFNVNIGPSKIKLVTLHPKKQWLTLLTTTNSFFLWNYRERILIKSFHCSTFDASKNLQIKQIVFYDRESLPYPCNNTKMSNTLIFISNTKIFLYDYITDAIKEINDKEMDQKGIKKVCTYSETKICVSLTDGSLKIMDNRDLYTKNMMPIKTIRGYHTKSINWLIAYCQNQNEMPRIITVSGADGLMACWNIQTIIQSNTENASPSFKFSMGKRNDSNNGQQIIYVQYDNSSYRLLTVTESYITTWSTMTGYELRRLKNSKFKEIIFMNHFSMGSNCFLAHSGKSQLSLLRLHENGYEVDDFFDIRSWAKQATDSNIINLKALPHSASQIVVATNSSLFVIELTKFYKVSFGYHCNFTTHLSTCKDFIIKGENLLRSNISFAEAEKATFEEDILFNSFFLSFDNGWIYFNLIQIQFENMLHEQRKYKMSQVKENSPLRQIKGSQTVIEISSDGKEFFIFNKELGYFQIWGNASQQQSLLGDSANNIDFYSKLVPIYSGCAKDIVWHQFRSQLAAIKLMDKNEVFIEYIEQKKGGIFNRNEKKLKLKLSGEGVYDCSVLYQKNKKSKTYEITYKTKPIASKICRVLNLGTLFGYSIQKNNTEVIQFLQPQKNDKEIQGTACFPEKVYISYCESYQIYVYDGYFIIYKMLENGSQKYFRSIQQTILHGIFWQKLFFFSTKNSIFFLHITAEDIILIKIADSIEVGNKQEWEIEQYDDLQPSCILKPEGQLQLLGIINYHLMILNHLKVLSLINLKMVPYAQFCIAVVCSDFQKMKYIWNHCNKNLRQSMKQPLNSYGISINQLT